MQLILDQSTQIYVNAGNFSSTKINRNNLQSDYQSNNFDEIHFLLRNQDKNCLFRLYLFVNGFLIFS